MARREPRNRTETYPGGLRARWRWGGSGQAAAVFALSEAGGALLDLGPSVSDDPDALCRAELRLEGPRGAWTARFASTHLRRARGRPTGTRPGCSSWPTGSTPFGLDAATGERSLGAPLGDADRRAARLARWPARPRPGGDRDVRHRARRDGRLAGRPQRRRHRRRARRRPARPDRVRRPAQRARPGDRSPPSRADRPSRRGDRVDGAVDNSADRPAILVDERPLTRPGRAP